MCYYYYMCNINNGSGVTQLRTGSLLSVVLLKVSRPLW